jgi:preprotein translocase subunit SecF
VGGVETRVQVGGEQPVGEDDIRDALSGAELADSTVFRLGPASDRTFVVRARGDNPDELAALATKIEQTLSAKIGQLEIERSDVVGPRVGQEFRNQAWFAMILSIIGIGIYTSLRFAPRYVPGVVLALIHDAVLSGAAVVLAGLTIDFTVVAALLTVAGYSMNDTIVIYDRIRENAELRTTAQISRLVNDSLNQTLSRTVLTAGTVLLTSVALLIFGGDALRGFALAITVGVAVGTYSTIFVAAPSLIYLSRGETKTARAAA